MKKSILMISAAAACAVACGFGACSCKNENSGNAEYDKLNGMLGARYSEINLTVTSTYDENTSLKSEYIITYSDNAITVEYSVERFSSLSIDNSPTGYKYVLSGEASIENGVVTGGEEVGITESFANPKFNFNKANFENAAFDSVSFAADVKNSTAFWGLAVSCTDMKVYAVWINDAFSSIKIDYTQNNAEVVYRYVFS